MLQAVALVRGVSPLIMPSATKAIAKIGTPVARAHARTVRAITPGTTGRIGTPDSSARRVTGRTTRSPSRYETAAVTRPPMTMPEATLIAIWTEKCRSIRPNTTAAAAQIPPTTLSCTSGLRSTRRRSSGVGARSSCSHRSRGREIDRPHRGPT